MARFFPLFCLVVFSIAGCSSAISQRELPVTAKPFCPEPEEPVEYGPFTGPPPAHIWSYILIMEDQEGNLLDDPLLEMVTQSLIRKLGLGTFRPLELNESWDDYPTIRIVVPSDLRNGEWYLATYSSKGAGKKLVTAIKAKNEGWYDEFLARVLKKVFEPCDE